MRKYPTSLRAWGLLTAGFMAAYLAWEYRTSPRPRDTLWGWYVRVASGQAPLADAGALVVNTLVLYAFACVPAWLVYVATFAVVRRLTRRPRSEQASDYADP